MFGKVLKYRRGCSIIYIIKNEQMFFRTWEVHMSYKKIIIELVEKLEESDERFLKQLYTIIKKHLERKEGI